MEHGARTDRLKRTSFSGPPTSVRVRLPVLCCCHPENQIGTAPVGLPYPTRKWTDGSYEGLAYPSGDVDWLSVEGFATHRRGGRRPKRTWKEDKKKGGRRTWKR